MNELKGNFVNVVLSIEEARGFDSVKHPIYIAANFNGRIMESDVMEPRPSIIFNTEIVWETEKKLLRRARGAYSRVRLDFYTNEKKPVGFTLLCLRSAKIMPSSRFDLQVQYSWYKLLNVPTEFKRGTPELRASLIIKDSVTKAMPVASFENPKIDLPLQIPIKYTSDGFIQVGDANENLQRFAFKITVKTASNLDVLLPESVVFSKAPKKYHLLFVIFGMNIKSRYVQGKNVNEDIHFKESVVVNLLSNFNNMRMYFQHYPKIPVSFYNDETQLAWSELNIENIKWDESKLNQGSKLLLETDSLFQNENMNFAREPKLESTITIALHTTMEEGQGEGLETTPRVLYSSCTDESEAVVLVENKPERPRIPTNPNDVILVQNPATNTLEDEIKVIDSYKQFTVDIILDSIFWKRPPKNTGFTINFFHPKFNSYLSIKADIDQNVGIKILLENTVCKLTFVCAQSRIMNLIKNFSPKLQILDAKNQLVAQEIILECSKFITLTKPECSQMIKLKTLKDEELAELNLCMFLESCNVKQECNSYYNLSPPILDDNIVFENLDALENWKESEKCKFKDEMETTRREQLEMLQENWLSRKNKLEIDLKHNIERCKKLSHQLKKNALNASLDKNLEERKAKDDEFNLYLEIHKNTVKYSLCEGHELIEQISLLERDNNILRDILSEQNLEMQEIKKSALTGEQTKNLLQDLKALEEKHEEAQKDKNYFKLEWEKAAKEVHKLKLEDNKNLQNKIACEKEKLSQLSLDSYVAVSDL